MVNISTLFVLGDITCKLYFCHHFQGSYVKWSLQRNLELEFLNMNETRLSGKLVFQQLPITLSTAFAVESQQVSFSAGVSCHCALKWSNANLHQLKIWPQISSLLKFFMPFIVFLFCPWTRKVSWLRKQTACYLSVNFTTFDLTC